MASEDSDSGDDIPHKQPSPAQDDDPEDEEGDDEEEEYAVEKILTHSWKGKKLFFQVKWAGYDETTIEPEENLEGCPDELDAYYKKTGGRPMKNGPKPPGRPAASSTTNDRKRGAPEPKTKDGGGGAKRARTGRGGNGHKFTPPAGSWEDDLIGVETVARNADTGDLEGYIEWANGHKSRHPTRLLHQKCPQHMLRFYEAHVFFMASDEQEHAGAKAVETKSIAAAPKASSADKAVAAKNGAFTSLDDGGDDDDEDMDDVKGVASG